MIDTDSEKNFILNNILSSLNIGSSRVSLKYIIAGEVFTIQDMKHLVFKIKSPPILFFYQPSNENDQRNKLLDEQYINKLPFLNKLAILTICIDPPNFMEEDIYDIYIPVGICFKPNKI
jgi:hypothetical protein